MTAQASDVFPITDWQKHKKSPTNSSTDAISLAEIKESLEQVYAKQELIIEQIRRMTIFRRPNLFSVKEAFLAEKQDWALATTTTSIMFNMASESDVELKVDALSGPVQFFLKLMEFWRLDIEDACKLLGYELSDIKYIEQVLSGELPLRGRDPKDRIANLVVIRKRLDGLFKDVNVENEWLREKQADIGNKSPMELLLSGSMENLLLIKQFVEFVCGL